jgi:hypothetical protein
MSDVFLHVTSGAAAGADIALDDELVIGRSASGEGTLGGDPELSRQHCKVRLADAGLLIEDLGSTNGTYVNGVRVTEALSLRPGDTITLGATTIEVAGVLPGAQSTAERPIPPVQSTRIASTPAPTTPPPPEPAAAPPGPPAGMPAPPPGFEGPPPGFEGPPPGFPAGPPPGFPEGMPWPPPGFEGGAPPKGGLGMAPPEMVAKIRRMAILIALAGLLVGFGIATLVWKVL